MAATDLSAGAADEVPRVKPLYDEELEVFIVRMTRFPLRVDDGIVYVQPHKPIEGPPRGEVEPLEPEGPLCLGS